MVTRVITLFKFMSNIIVGNIFSFVAMILLFAATSKNNNIELLKIQGISHFFFALAGMVLKGYSGVIQDSVGFIRNMLMLVNINTKITRFVLLFIAVFLGIYFNNSSYIGILPIIGTFQYTIISTIKNISNNMLKYSMIINSLLMIIYSAYINNYVNIFTNILVIIISLLSVLKSKKNINVS